MNSPRPLQEQASSEQNSSLERNSAVADEKRPSNFAYFIPRIAGSLLGGYLLWRASREFFLLAPDIGSWWGRLSTKWAFAFLCFIGIHLLFFAAWLAALWLPQTMRAKLHAFASPLLRLRGIKKFRWPLAFAIVLLPTWFLLYTQLGGIFSGPYLRLLVLLD